MKLPPARVADFLRSPPVEVAAVLLYGPDRGLVSDRSRGLMALIAGADPFRSTTLGADEIAADPARLADEAAAGSLTGGRRAVRIRNAGDGLAGVLGGWLDGRTDAAPPANLLILEGPAELPPRSALRQLCEAAPAAAAIACYPAEGGALVETIRQMLDGAGRRADREVLVALADRLGADHGLLRAELDKLVLFLGDKTRVDLGDVQDCLGDGAQASLDELAIAVTEGAVAVVDRACRRLAADGVAPVRLVRAVQRHVDRLRAAALLAAEGQSEQAILSRLRIFFKQQPAYRRLFRSWPRPLCQRALDRLFALELACKTTGMPADTLVHQGLTLLALESGRPAAARRDGAGRPR